MTKVRVDSWVPGDPVEGDTIGQDRNTHHPLERSKLSLGVAGPDPNGRITITDTSGNVIRNLGHQSGTSHPTFDMPAEPGRYQVRENGDVLTSFSVESRTPSDPEPTGGTEQDAFNLRDEDTGPDPEDVAGIVNADNSSGAALAPSLRRRGLEVDDVGASASVGGSELEVVDEGVVEISGKQINVGDIQEADEVARVTDGPNAGDPVPTDADVAPGSSSGGSDGGLIGAVGVGLLALLAVGAALLGGDD